MNLATRNKNRRNRLISLGMTICTNNTLEIGTPDGFYYYSVPDVDYYAAISFGDIETMNGAEWAEKIKQTIKLIKQIDDEQAECDSDSVHSF